jgi:ABC-type branched-subunit amino acid transport system permease subunit
MLKEKLVCVSFVGVVILFAALFLRAESELAVIGLLLAGGLAAFIMNRWSKTAGLRTLFQSNERFMDTLALLGVIILTGIFCDDHYVLFLIGTILLYLIVCLGLNVQLGYAGVINFSGASFFGVGSYAAAVLMVHTGLSPLFVLVVGGVAAAIIGSILILPLLRTSGHYAALITIAFALLFKTFLEVNDALGGPQGLRVPSMHIGGWSFSNNIEIGSLVVSFYTSYVLFGLGLLALTFLIVRRLERSWVGLNMDAVRLDQTASACFGLNIARWKITAFCAGNFFAGVSGALYGMMLGYIAPSNFTFGDSLIYMSIILLGGLGNAWGLALATSIVVVLPEKLQVIQEYRFLLYASLVIIMLMYRPEGLLPRNLRSYFSVERSS